MVILKNPNNYELIEFQKSTVKNKKYDAILRNYINNKKIKISFGDIRYQQYKDSLGLYSHLDHLDKKRKNAFRARHKKNIDNLYSSAWFSNMYLWS